MRTIVTETDRIGECPTWDSRDRRLRWIDVVDKRLSSCDPDGGDIQREATDDFPGSFALRKRGGRLVAFRRRIALFDSGGTEVATATLSPDQIARERFNDGGCDSQGRFFVSTMDPRLKETTGGLYRVDPDLTITRLTEGVGIGNGIAWSPDDRLLYHCDSQPPVIYVHDYNVAAGTVANRREFVRLDPSEGKPDGCAMDVQGFLWMAAPGSGTILRFDPDGRIERRLPVPVRYPSSVAFGGDDRKTLYITSLRPPEGDPQPLDGAVFATEVDVAGVARVRFAG